MGAGARPLFPEQMGRELDRASFLQRSRRETARRRIARREIRPGLFYLHRVRVLSPIARRRPRSLPPLREYSLPARREMKRTTIGLAPKARRNTAGVQRSGTPGT